MNQVYLKRIALKDFRSFASLDIELPAEPSVLIVHGSNGLGKSSLFDSLEWVLSDSIDHFRDVNGVKKTGAYLCRWREGASGPTSAVMEFSDGSVIERSLASSKDVNSQLGGNVSDITAFLRSPEWGQPISEVQRYLLLTHFLGQSTFSRLTYRKPTERFDILQEAARNTDIDAIAAALHGQGTSSVARAYTRKIESLQRDVQNLEELLEQEASLFSETQIAGAIDDRTASTMAQQLIEELRSAFLERRDVTASSEHDVDSIIEQVLASIDQVENDCLAAEKSMAEARRLSDELRKTQVEIADIAASYRNYSAHSEKTVRAWEEARILNVRHQEEIKKSQSALAETTVYVSAFRDLSNARSLISKLEQDMRSRESILKSSSNTKTECERAVALSERRQQLASRLSAEFDNCEEEIRRVRIQKAGLEKILLGQENIAQQRATLTAIQSEFPDLGRELERTKNEADIAMSEVIAQQKFVNELRIAVGEMSSAITTLATRLPTEECNCPLCDTHFDDATILATRVSNAAQRLAPTLAAQENILKEKSALRDQRLADFNRLKDATSRFEGVQLQIAAQKKALYELISDFGQSLVEPSLIIERQAQLDVEIARMNARCARKRRWVSHPVLESTMWSNEHSRAIRARDVAQRSFEAATRALTDIRSEIERYKADERRILDFFGPDHRLITSDLATELREAEVARQGLSDAVSRFTHMANQSASSIALLETEARGVQARLNEMSESRAGYEAKLVSIRAAWNELTQFGAEPDVERVDALSRRVLASRHVLQMIKPQLSRLRDGRFVWARLRSHGAIIEQISSHMSDVKFEDRDQLLMEVRKRLAQKQDELADVINVRGIAKEASAEISAELAEFNSEYIKPLGQLMSQINQAILCDSRVGIDLHVKSKKIEQRALKRGELPRGAENIDPLLIHSEGQMAALAVSMLCAASLTFPWSRWKALVLDDPLQHNDSIHVAAFSDLIANLISSEGYQVLISTHDIAQAEFLQRKFSSRRIPCKTLSLLGQGADGVEWKIRTEPTVKPHEIVRTNSIQAYRSD